MAPKKPKQDWASLNHYKRLVKKKRKEQQLKKLLIKEKKEQNPHKEERKVTMKILPTVSIAVPGSILSNAQSAELRTYLAGQIARAACIYQIDEVIVFDDKTDSDPGNNGSSESCQQLAMILQYLECPQYLRKHLFPIHKGLKYAGVLNPLDAPHHLRKEDKFPYREGVVLTLPPKPGKGSYVDVGLQKPVIIDKILEPYFRVTVKLHSKAYETTGKMYGWVVSPTIPKAETGTYWGYSVRVAGSLNDVFTQCPYSSYDLTIGTSDKGASVDELEESVKKYEHCLIVFGGLQGLEAALENDSLNIEDVSLLFDYYLNTCPQQASRTIRTEEAILISLAELRKKLRLNAAPSISSTETTNNVDQESGS